MQGQVPNLAMKNRVCLIEIYPTMQPLCQGAEKPEERQPKALLAVAHGTQGCGFDPEVGKVFPSNFVFEI